jgi:uncharacterized membrane protein
MNTLEKYVCIFLVYAIAGWFMESFRGWFKTKKFVNRGFLIGPCLPVYGFGVVLITFCLEKYVNDIGILFGMSIILCGILEYFTSWIMEKLFKARWWDYHNRKFNINGRVCLETLIPFGILGTVLLKFVNPFVLGLLSKIPNNILKWILIVITSIFIIDVIISFTVVSKLRKTAKKVENEAVKDNTEEMNEKVKEVTTEKVNEIKENITDKIEEAKEGLGDIPKRVDIGVKYMKRKASYTSNKFIVNIRESSDEFKKKGSLARAELWNKLNNSKNKVIKGAEHISNSIKYNLIFKSNKEYTDAVKKEFKTKSWLTNRLAEAFPDMIIISKKLKFKNKK